jgi:hypothetical protein
VPPDEIPLISYLCGGHRVKGTMVQFPGHIKLISLYIAFSILHETGVLGFPFQLFEVSFTCSLQKLA